MFKFKFIPLLYIILLAACQQEVAIPTLRVLPSPTYTVTASVTPTATNTLIASFTPSPTVTATLSRTPTNTPIPTISPTPTLTRTPTLTPTPTATLTPLPTRTPEPLVINLYQSSIRTGNHGDPVRFRWDTNGETARIERLDAQGNVVESLPVDPIGSYSTNLPPDGALVIYRLVAMRQGEETSSSISFNFQAACTIQWFFQTADDVGCATTGVMGGQLYYQQFERGFMIRLVSAGRDRVCGVQNDSNIYTCFNYQPFTGTPTVTPVPNRFAPGDAFAGVFYNQLAIGGFWYDQIGWATSQQVNSNTSTQTNDRGIMYVQTPQGIIGFDQDLNGGLTITRIQSQ